MSVIRNIRRFPFYNLACCRLPTYNNKCNIATNLVQHYNKILLNEFNQTCQPVRFYTNTHFETIEKNQSNEDCHESTDDQDSDKRTKYDVKYDILNGALKYVHEYGWTNDAINKASQDLGYSTSITGLFEDAGSELVLHFINNCNTNLVEYLKNQSNENEEKQSSTQLIKKALKHRLEMICPYADVWGDAMAILLKPQNVIPSTKSLAKMVDNIWHYSGDQSADFSWYTKRGLLTKVYLSTQTVMITDKSADYEDTWKFMDRRRVEITSSVNYFE